MTYRELLNALHELDDSQLDCTCTVEFGISDEYFAAELRICDIEHDVLDENHPVIYVPDA